MKRPWAGEYMKSRHLWFCPSCRLYRTWAVVARIYNIVILRTCSGCPLRRKRFVSRHDCPLRAMPEYKAGLLSRRREENRRRAYELSIKAELNEIFGWDRD